MAKNVINKDKMRLINQRAHSLAQDAYAFFRLQMIEALTKDENFNPTEWQPGEHDHDQP
jgi:hypothetical protein